MSEPSVDVPRIVLASKSPRRAELLARLGVEFEVLEVDIPEVPAEGEAPEDYVQRLARDKAAAGLAALASGGRDAAVAVIGSDTEVVLGDRIYGKPADVADAAAMLRSLSGRGHRVLTAVALATHGGIEVVLNETRVRFARLDDAAIAAYVASGDAFGKAGAYGIQGRAGAFVEHLSGSHSAVMGLPLHETARLLARIGAGPLAVGTRLSPA